MPYHIQRYVEFKQYQAHDDYEAQVYLSEYLFQSVIHATYYPNSLIAANQTVNGINTFTVNGLVLNALWMHGWRISPAQPCVVDIYSLGDEFPEFFVNGSNS